MATRNIVPRATGEGQIGTSAKTWSAVYANDIAVTNGVTAATFTGDLTGDVTGDVTGDLTGTASKATADENGNNIASTYLPAVVGAIVAFAGSTSPTGWLLCDGSAVSRTDYAALFAVIGTTYGSGDGSTTFNVPNLVDKFVEGSATSGTVKSAGLPNIQGLLTVGVLGASTWDVRIATGAFSTPSATSATRLKSPGYETRSASDNINFKASDSNAIYGNSTTVQPPAVTMRYIIKY